MYSLVYVSSAINDFSDPDLLRLLESARKKNKDLNITGMLLYKGGNFMQALEGNKDDVISVYERIALDPRHKGLIVLTEGEVSERQFPDWSMAFKNMDSNDYSDVPGYSEFLNYSFTSDEFKNNPVDCHRLMLSFRDSMR